MAPNDFAVVEAVYQSRTWDLVSTEGLGAFTESVVASLHAHDPRWGHLKKRPGQTQINGHAEDSALYLSDTPGQSQAVDFVGGVRTASARPAWTPDEPRYSASDWYAPGDPVAPPVVPPVAPLGSLPDRAEALDALSWLDAYYGAPEGLRREHGLSLNGAPDFEGIAAWHLDVYQTRRLAGDTRDEARAEVVRQIRQSGEWQAKHPGETP